MQSALAGGSRDMRAGAGDAPLPVGGMGERVQVRVRCRVAYLMSVTVLLPLSEAVRDQAKTSEIWLSWRLPD